MKKLEHTPGVKPGTWSISKARGVYKYHIMDDKRNIVAHAYNYEIADRVMSCHNACQGIEDPETTVPELIEALDIVSQWMLLWPDDNNGLYQKARAALAKVKG